MFFAGASATEFVFLVNLEIAIGDVEVGIPLITALPFLLCFSMSINLY